MSAGRTTFWLLAALLFVGLPALAFAMFGEEGWVSGQNELLAELLMNEMQELTQISTLVSNARLLVASTNDMLALARTTKRVYDIASRYTLAQLVEDARHGLYKAMPELARTELEVRELIDNGRALEHGEGAFFSRITFHDASVSAAARRSFEHGYQATIWPVVFPKAMSFLPNPSPVELMIQERYRRTDDERQRAIQRTALGVLARKVQAFADDAEGKDNVQLKMEATNAEVNFQSMAHLTELRNLEEQDAAEKEVRRGEDGAMRDGLARALKANAALLVSTSQMPEVEP